MGGVKLIVVSIPDIASYNQGKALLQLGGWESGPVVENCETYSQSNVRMWFLDQRLLLQDHLDKRFTDITGEEVSEVIFPSRHVAASGQPSLTLHPIGVMHHHPGEEVPFGGLAGRAPPPNTRLGPWFRELLKLQGSEISERYSLSLEVTHHGPWMESPALFIEIGSTESHWPDEEAAAVLADITWRGLGLDGSNGIGGWSEEENAGEKVVVGFGGGHYALRIGSVCANDGIWLGHMLANYALPMEKPPGRWDPLLDTLPKGRWSAAIDEAIDATRRAFPGGEIWAYMDRKSFKGWERQSIRRHLESIGVPIGRTKDLITG